MAEMVTAVKVPEKPKNRGRVMPGRRAGYGRAKGTPNKVTKIARDIARGLTLDNDKVVEQVRKKFEVGTIDPSLFNKLLEYGYGKPKQVVEIIPPANPALSAARAFYDSLSPDERKLALGFARRRRAISELNVIDVAVRSDGA